MDEVIDDIWNEIILLLDLKSLFIFARACKHYHQLIRNYHVRYCPKHHAIKLRYASNIPDILESLSQYNFKYYYLGYLYKEYLQYLTNIQRLNITRILFEVESNEMRKLINLRQLRIRTGHVDTLYLIYLTKLESLKVSLTNGQLSNLSHLSNLTCLCLGSRSHITNYFLST